MQGDISRVLTADQFFNLPIYPNAKIKDGYDQRQLVAEPKTSTRK